MANDYYNPTGAPVSSTQAATKPFRDEYALVGAGFDKLAPITGKANLPIFVNSTGTAEITKTASEARTLLGLGTAAVDDATDYAPIAHVGAGGAEHADVVSGGADGFMTGSDKARLDTMADNANAYVHPNHTGDVTSTGDGATVIANNAVTLAKLATQAAYTIIANLTSGIAVPTAATATQIRALLNVADGANAYVHPNHTGPVTSTGDGATAITDKAITLAKMDDMATASFLGRASSGSGVPEVLSVSSSLALLGVSPNAGLLGVAARSIRCVYVEVLNGTVANTLKCQVLNVFNGAAVVQQDSLGKGAATADFSLNAAGTVLSVGAGRLGGTLEGVISCDVLQWCGDTYVATARPEVVAGVLNISTLALFSGSGLDMTVMVDSGGGALYFRLIYITS